MTRHIPVTDWPAELKEFTDRNAGRLTIIEEYDPNLGAQQEEQGLEFRGIAYDPHDRSVAFMLGPLEGTDHITHVVRDVRSIDVLKNEDRAEVMRVAHGTGQTILRFFND